MDLVAAAIMEVAYDGSPEAVRRISTGTGLPAWAIRRAKPAKRRLGPSSRQWPRWQEQVVQAHLGMLTEAEVEALRESIPLPQALEKLGELTLEEIGQRIGRSANAVKIKVVRKGWRVFLKNPEWLTGRDVGDLMGVDSHAVTRWIQRGYLRGDLFPYQGKTVHRVRWEDLERFILDAENWAYYSVEKIGDGRLRELALSVRDGREYVTTGYLARKLGCSVNWIASLIRRGKIPAKRWDNYQIRREDAARVELPGPGTQYSSRSGFSPQDDLYLVRARSVGIAYTEIGSHLNRQIGALSYRWATLKRKGLERFIEGDEALHGAGARVLGSWRLLARKEGGEQFRELARAIGRFRAGRELTGAEVLKLSGLFYAWTEFFVDGRQLRWERKHLRFRPWRGREELDGVYRRLLDFGLDPCRERWTWDWEFVIRTGRRKMGFPPGWDTEGLEWRGWGRR
jgi:hypothetical protein